MLKDITIGQYLYKDSFVHSLDPRTKIICAMIFMISILFVQFLYEYILVLLMTLVTIYKSKIPIRKLTKGFKPILPLIILTAVINIFFTSGTPIFEFGLIHIAWEGLNLATFMALRIFFLIIFTSLLTLTTSPISLTNGIEGLLLPLKIIKVPAHEIAMMISIALRFIPTLTDEADKIMKAQKARGADFETGNLLKRTRSLIPVLIPLFINAFTRAEDLALAMEARGYKGDKDRTKFKELRYKKNDIFALFLFLLILATLIIRGTV